MKKRLFLLALVLCLLCACGGNVKMTADISAYGDTPIEISGLTDEDFTVTPNELAKLACVARTQAGRSAKAGTVTAVGPLLNTFLEQYGCTQTDFKKIRVLAADGYKTVLRGDMLEYEVILSVSEGDEPLEELYRPVRLLIPDAESSYWTYQVTRIEFVKDDQ